MKDESPEIQFQQLIQESTHLFWWVPEDKKNNISLESLVEAILNYGNSASVKKLFDLYGIAKISGIFYEQINRPRTNYLEQTKYYFSLYFKKYAH